MATVKDAMLSLGSLSVYKGILTRTVGRAFYELLCAAGGDAREFGACWGRFFSLLCERGYSQNFAACMMEMALYDDNVFSRACASLDGPPLPEPVMAAVERDLRVLCDVSQLTPEELIGSVGDRAVLGCLSRTLPRWETGERLPMFEGKPSEYMKKMAAFYAYNGCGQYARYSAFLWREGRLEPVHNPDPVRFSALKGYRAQQETVRQNTLDFVEGRPANNMLLYGDRGTGKSSTVKALLNEYHDRGLRMVELPKEILSEFPLLAEKLSRLPLRFILFIDDLSFVSLNDSYTALKAVLEGGLTVRPDNVLIYATSNRRHLIREVFSDRADDEVHRSDTINENLSLADRFGLSVCFSVPTREEYLKIVKGIAADGALSISPERLEEEAEQWALARGGRTPRAARQYIDYASARAGRQSKAGSPEEKQKDVR